MDCGRALCPDCAAVRRVHPVDLLVCCLCGGRAELLQRHRSATPLRERLKGVWRFPARSDSLPALLGMAAWITVLSGGALLLVHGLDHFETLWGVLPAGVLTLVYSVGLTCAWMNRIIRRTYVDLEPLDGPEVTSLLGDVVRPAVIALLGLCWLWLPALMRLTQPGSQGVADPVLWLLALVGLAYLPAVLLVAAAGGSVFEVTNPLRVANTLLSLRAAAGQVLPLTLLTLLPAIALEALAFRAWRALPLVGPYLTQVAALYLLAVLGRALGIVLRVYGDRVGYGHAPDYLEPALQGVAPRGAAPAAPPPG